MMMQTIFLINPKAGQGKAKKIIERVEALQEKYPGKIEIYLTRAKGDGEDFIRKTCRERQGETLRFVACGGDGTISEAVNGVMGFPNACVSAIPLGSGNDFCRNFPDVDFKDIEGHLHGECVPCDAISLRGKIDGIYQERFAINMFNIGFDCNVVDQAAKYKKYPLISGHIAYLFGIFTILIKKKGARLKVLLDGEVVHEGPLLLTALANGKFCGGGVMSNPKGSLHDGEMDVNVIYNVSRTTFLKLYPRYSKGTFMEVKGIEKIINYLKCKHAIITPLEGTMRLCTDGEISTAEEIEFSVVRDAFQLSLPKKEKYSLKKEKKNSKIKLN